MKIPTLIQLEDNGLLLEFENNKYLFPYKYLRLQCPCANCVEEMTGKQRLDPDTVPADVRAIDSMMIGSYAVQFLWSDAHYTGIYPYNFLRNQCTCIACNQERG